MNILEDLRKFHLVFEVPIREQMSFPGAKRVKLRQKLLQEEVYELNQAIDARNYPAMAQELIDSIYVLVGMALEFGVPVELVWNEVHRANMRKVAENGVVHRRPDGKILKPANWFPADILGKLAEAGYKPSPQEARRLGGG